MSDASGGQPVRAVDLVARLGVAQPTVAKGLARLRRKGLVESEARATLRLTKRGRAIALDCKRRHEIVLKFLRKLGLPQDVVERDAEGIEHHVSGATLRALETLTRQIAPRSRQGELPL